MLWLIWPTHLYKLYSRTDIPFSVWSYACGSDLICLTSPKIWSAYSRTARDVFMKANTGGSQTCRRHRSGRIQVPSETTVSAPSSPHYADLRRDLRYLRQYHRYSEEFRNHLDKTWSQVSQRIQVCTSLSTSDPLIAITNGCLTETLRGSCDSGGSRCFRRPSQSHHQFSVTPTGLGGFSLSFVLFVNNLSDTLPGMGYTPLLAINRHWTCPPEDKDQGLTLLYSQSYKGQIPFQ